MIDETEISDGKHKLQQATIYFSEIAFSDGTRISLDRNDIVVFVGPNNAGKSVALKELEQHIGEKQNPVVIPEAKFEKVGDNDDITAFLATHGRYTRRTDGNYFEGYRYKIPESRVEKYWQTNIQTFRPVFCMRIATETRITDSNPADSISILDQNPQHPAHIIYADDAREERISNYFRRAFGFDLIMFRSGGSKCPFLVGEKPPIESGEQIFSVSYVERLRKYTVALHEQGDGMRAFATVILHTLAPTTHSIILLDEPEAFLHPPQAKLLGEFLATDRPEQTQLFVATHSSDVLQGLLAIAPENLRIIRLQRQDSKNVVTELDKPRAKKINADPLLRYSSVMSGIFHQRVILCESDADCMFYNAILDLPNVRGEVQPDVMFVHAGGKQRLSTLADSMRALGVPVDVIVDLDILNDLAVFQRLVESLGGDWSLISRDAVPLKSAIEQHKPWLNASEVAKGISEILEQTPTSGEFPKTLKSDIMSVFRKASPWDAVKSAGVASFPAGQATLHYNSVRAACETVGLWIVPVGELEGFCKSVGGHGPGWVQSVLENRDLANDSELSAARTFVEKIWRRLAT